MNSPLFTSIVEWIKRTADIKSAVLFGSSVSTLTSRDVPTNRLSDCDLHIISSNGKLFDDIDWKSALVNEDLCFQACRQATGSGRKITLVFSSGQLDLVVIPLVAMRIAAIALRFGCYQHVRIVRSALNEMATCLHFGYRFLKGHSIWSAFYGRVAALPGVRLCDQEIQNLADTSVCDLLWILQKANAGELIASQHALHLKLSDTNLRLWRELRCRKSLYLPSFGLGRRVEAVANESERRWLQVSANLDIQEIRCAAWKAYEGLRTLMTQLDPAWSVSSPMVCLLNQYRVQG